MKKNEKKSWAGRFITKSGSAVSEEPPFSLEDMFSGRKPDQNPAEERLKPVLHFTRKFRVEGELSRAVLTITAHGVYHAEINGREADDSVLAPDFTSYGSFLQYQVLDVTELVRQGENCLDVLVADGWYSGRISVQGGSAQFGTTPALLLDLELKYSDGRSKTIGSDCDFTVKDSYIRYSDIQIGEMQDLVLKNDEGIGEHAVLLEGEDDYDVLCPQEGPQVRRHQILSAVKIWREDDGFIVDFGQVIAGRVRLCAAFPKGREVVIEHAEVLDEDGRFFSNIVGRNKDQRDVVVGRGDFETFEPLFTFHGFRYARIRGLYSLEKDQIKAVVIFSDMKETGSIHVSDPDVERLLENIRWSQRGNMISIPTDCPQRERMGWTGDMQVFAPASTFYYDTEELISRWLHCVRSDQQADGEIPDYSPIPRDFLENTGFTGSLSSAGWGDAIIMVPWTMYQRYGHRKILEDNLDAMVSWHEYERRSAAGGKTGTDRYVWDNKFNYGDWMFPSFMMENPNPMKTSEVTRDLVGTVFLAHSAELLGKIFEVLEKDGSDFFEYAENVRSAFTERFVTEDGRLKNDYQGCYVLAIAFDMVSDDVRKLLAKRLAEMIVENGCRLDTGFLSVPYLLDVLCDNGYEELATRLFMQKKCPSWLYEVEKGATTIWESWACITPDGHVGTFSFNHYAMGCVLDWFVRRVCGLRMLTPGGRMIAVNPDVDLSMDFELEYRTEYGKVRISKVGENIDVETTGEIEVVR